MVAADRRRHDIYYRVGCADLMEMNFGSRRMVDLAFDLCQARENINGGFFDFGGKFASCYKPTNLVPGAGFRPSPVSANDLKLRRSDGLSHFFRRFKLKLKRRDFLQF